MIASVSTGNSMNRSWIIKAWFLLSGTNSKDFQAKGLGIIGLLLIIYGVESKETLNIDKKTS